MSALRDAMSHAALGWVKPELDETLRQVRNEIELFVEEPTDTSRMRFCAGYLHQVQGTLRMMELYAPAMVAEELELLAKAVQAGGLPDRDEACATLMRGTVLLPDYLERLQNGHRDIPIVLLPLLNEIRAARGEAGLNESVLFAFDPKAGDATPEEIDHARGSLSGRNRELLDTVGSAVKEELLRVKDALDLHLRTGGDVAELQTQVNDLASVGDTLGMMGLGVARNVVVQQRDALRAIVEGKQQIDEGLLLDIAGALLYVDASLDDQVASLGAANSEDDVAANASSSEVRRTLDVLAHEAIANFAAAREHFVAFIETNWDHARLADVPRLLDEVAGALRILELPLPADYLEGVRRYVENELVAKRRVPSGRQLDTLADAMASLEYYLEALRERRPGREEILDITRSALETLRYWPLPPLIAATSASPAEQSEPAPAAAVAAVEPEPVAAAPVAVEPAVVEPAAVQAPAPTVEVEPEPVVAAASEDASDAPNWNFADLELAPIEASAPSAGLSFDPVAAEQEHHDAPAASDYVVAPVDLSGDGGQAPVDGDWRSDADASTPAFDPVAAEQPEQPAGAAVSYTFDTSSLEGEDSASSDAVAPFQAPVEPVSPAPVAQQPTRELPPLPPLPPVEEPAPAAVVEEPVAAAPIEEDSPFVESAPANPEQVENAESAEPAARQIHEGVIGKIELDDATAAFMAELDAAAASFNAGPATPAPAAPVAPPPAAEPAPAPVAEPVAASALSGGFEDDEGEIDEDIREVFLEEFDEELSNLGQLLPVWRAAPGSVENLRPIRRVFHTLKGSGRLVGARTLGEFSWKIESMLNRVLDGSRPASPAVVAMVTQAYEVLPQLNAALRGQAPISADLLAMQAIADRVAAGEEAHYVPTVAAEPEPLVAAPVAAEPVVAAPVELATGTPASVDSVLREILEAEVATHLETVHGWLAGCRGAPQPVSEALLRAVHTMSGAFAMTDVPEITAVTTPAESFLKRSLAAARVPGQDGVNGIADTATAIATTITALQAESPLIPSFAALAERLRALVDTLPEAQWPPQHLEEVEIDEVEATPVAAASELTVADDLSAYLGGEPVELTIEDVPADVAASEPGDALPDLSSLTVEDEIEATTVQTPVVVNVEPASVEADDVDAFDVAALDGFAAAEPVAETPEETVGDSGLQIEEIEASVPVESDAFAGIESWQIEEVVLEAPAEPVDSSIAASDAPTAADDALVGETQAIEEELAERASLHDDLADAVEPAAEPVADSVEPIEVVEVIEAVEAVEATAPAQPVEAPVAVVADESAALDLGPLDFTDLDAELVDIFVEEGKDLLDHCDGLIAGLRDQPEDREIVAGLQRDLHTLKGGARMAGINAIGDLGHGIESLLEAVAANRTEISHDDVRLLERGFDRLHQLLIRTGNHRAVPMPMDLIESFDARAHGRAEVQASEIDVQHMISTAVEPSEVEPSFAPIEAEVPAAVDTPSVAPAADEPAVEETAIEETAVDASTQAPVETVAAEPAAVEPVIEPVIAAPVAPPVVESIPEPVASAPLSAPVPVEGTVVEEDNGLARAPQEQVRVRADLLDRLVNHAGEVAIYRSRLEQQLGAFRGAMAELDRTNARLRDQLRRLDLETEAQIVARYQREQDQGDTTFDPLELDRFSTLQQLSRALNESAADLGGLQGVLDDLSRQYDSLLQQQSRVSSELQDGLMRARMVPFEGLVPRLRRVVRQAGSETHKHVRLLLEGTHGELDRNVLDRMVAPLEHMLRNSVAHGLETPEQRRAAGKPEEGVIGLKLRREGSEIVLEVSDDGAGLDREAIRRRGEERGLIAPGAVLSDSELDALIFASGFSTSATVSQLAGRGVGMDVVRNEVRQLGGSVDIHSVRGQGTTFTLRLPQTLAVTQAVFVRIGEATFAVPVASVSGIGRIARSRYESGVGGYHYAGEEYTLHDLGSLVNQSPATADGAPQIPLLLVRAGDLRAAVAIDQVLGNREIVVKPVGLQIASVPGIYGATITGDGRVVVILDVAPLVRRHLSQPARPSQNITQDEQRRVPLVMVVDDSLTMRKVTSRVLERHNLEVVVARDGVEALERLDERVPDLMLLDIEMPRMDGYELATAMRADARYKDVPIVMITSRSGDKHRQRAFEIGVQRYLGKPYQELDLMRNVYDLLGIARVRE